MFKKPYILNIMKRSQEILTGLDNDELHKKGELFKSKRLTERTFFISKNAFSSRNWGTTPIPRPPPKLLWFGGFQTILCVIVAPKCGLEYALLCAGNLSG